MTDAGTSTTPGRRGFTATHAAVVSALLWIASFVAVRLGAHAPWRAGLTVGVIAAALSGIGGLAAVALTDGQKLNVVLLGKVTSFLGRMLLLAVGLVITVRALHAEPLGFVLAFFPLFFASTILEQFVWMTGKTGGTPAVTAGGAH